MKIKKPATSKDVALKAGVSRSTVSRALNDLDCVTKSTKHKILKAANELGYEINMLGRSLNQQKTNLIGLIIKNIKDSFHVMLLEKLLQIIQKNNYLAIVNEISSDEDIQPTIKKFAQFRVSGVIITSGSPPQGISKECKKLNIPVILINHIIEKEKKIDIICSNNFSGTNLAISELINAKCKKIHFLNINNSTYSGKMRGESFLKIMQNQKTSKNISFDFLTSKSNDYKGGFNTAKYVLNNNIEIDGIFCANDILAIGFIDGAREFLKKEAGVDYSIIGFDDIKQSSLQSYKLTTIRQNIDKIVTSVMNKLEDRIKEPETKASFEFIEVDLIKRNTIKNN